MVNAPPLEFPIRGIPGGHRDWWDDSDDHAELRARGEATEHRQMRLAEVLGVAWRAQIADETPVRSPQQQNRPA